MTQVPAAIGGQSAPIAGLPPSTLRGGVPGPPPQHARIKVTAPGPAPRRDFDSSAHSTHGGGKGASHPVPRAERSNTDAVASGKKQHQGGSTTTCSISSRAASGRTAAPAPKIPPVAGGSQPIVAAVPPSASVPNATPQIALAAVVPAGVSPATASADSSRSSVVVIDLEEEEDEAATTGEGVVAEGSAKAEELTPPLRTLSESVPGLPFESLRLADPTAWLQRLPAPVMRYLAGDVPAYTHGQASPTSDTASSVGGSSACLICAVGDSELRPDVGLPACTLCYSDLCMMQGVAARAWKRVAAVYHVEPRYYLGVALLHR